MTYSSAQIAEFLAQYNESNTSLNEFCRQKQISVGTMSNWLNGALPKRRRSHGFHKTWYPEIEEELLRWVLERRDQGYAVYRKDMKEYAEELAAASGQEIFQGSVGWITRFMHKNDLVFRARTKISRRLGLTEEDIVS